MGFTKITNNIYAVGGSGLSNSNDAMVYLVKTNDHSLVLIDSGTNSQKIICKNIEQSGNDPKNLIGLILTHCHIDHIGSAHDFKTTFPKIKIYGHEWDRAAIEGKPGTEGLTAANWYGIKYKPVKLDIVFEKEEEKQKIGGTIFTIIHTPGHTPGSISVIVEDDGKRILFGQDIHGPFMKEFNSNIDDWRRSMKILLSKNCDILAEGHFGIYKTKDSVEHYINSQLMQHR